MRVIGGKLKGRKLVSPSGESIRPTSDMAKQGIFNVLQFDIEGSRFVDLFSGSGAIGIEALSRGAAEVVFCDNGREGILLTGENLRLAKLIPNAKYRLMSRDWRDCLRGLSGKWNYIFCDPPYGSVSVGEIAETVKHYGLLEDDGYLIYEHDSAYKTETPSGFELAKSRKYGRITVDYYAPAADVCALTGSFDPFTVGHMDVLRSASALFDHIHVGVLSNSAKTPLFAADERVAMIEAAVRAEGLANVSAASFDGLLVEFVKRVGAQYIIRGLRAITDFEYEFQIDATNRHLEPQVRTVYFMASPSLSFLSSSTVREIGAYGGNIAGLVPACNMKIIAERLLRA